MASHLNNKDLLQPGAFINNEFIKPAGPEFDVVDPGNAEVWATLSSCTELDVDVAVKAAEKAFESYRKVSARERAKLLLEWDRLIRANKADLARLLVLETGKPFK